MKKTLGEIFFIAGKLEEDEDGSKRVVTTIDQDDYGAFANIGNHHVDGENKYFFMHLAYRGEKKPKLEIFTEDQLQQLCFVCILFSCSLIVHNVDF